MGMIKNYQLKCMSHCLRRDLPKIGVMEADVTSMPIELLVEKLKSANTIPPSITPIRFAAMLKSYVLGNFVDD